MSSKLLWFLIGSAATLIGATVAANFMGDESQDGNHTVNDDLEFGENKPNENEQEAASDSHENDPSRDTPSTPETEPEDEQ